MGVLVGLVALGHLAFTGASPIAGGPREPVASYTPAERWTPPPPVRDARFATFPFVADDGRRGLWVLPSATLPLRFVLEREVADRFGEQAVRQAVTAWNDVPGSRFAAEVDRIVEAGVDERRRDGVHRIFMDRRSCGGRYLARAHLWPGRTVARDGLVAQQIGEVDLGLCDRLRPEQLEKVIRHELGHIAGLDHLCDADEDCHHPAMDADNTCRIMGPRADPCQAVHPGDLDGLVHLHPRLPRASGTDARATSAAVSLATHPRPRSARFAVITPYDADLGIRVAAAALAGHLDAPQLLVDDDCTAGPAGRALDRVVTVNGTVVATGPVTTGCLASLRGAWSLDVERLPARSDVEDRIVAALTDRDGAPPQRLLVAPLDAPSRGTPVAAVAASAAVTLDAALTFVDEPDDAGPALRLVADHDELREVLLIADISRAGLEVTMDLVRAGVGVRRLSAADAPGATIALTGAAGLPLPRRLPVAIASAEHPEHAVPAITLAAHLEGLLLPIERPLREDHLALLRDRANEGAIVGSRQAISTEQQRALSRLVDRDTSDLAVLTAP